MVITGVKRSFHSRDDSSWGSIYTCLSGVHSFLPLTTSLPPPLMSFQGPLLLRSSLVVFTTFLLRLGWRTLGTTLNKYFTRKMTILLDLDSIGKSRPPSQKIKGTAVICGGRCVNSFLFLPFFSLNVDHLSIAGLWTARICADHFDEVLIVEPEEGLQAQENCNPVYDEKGDYNNAAGSLHRSRVSQYQAAHSSSFLVIFVGQGPLTTPC